MAERHRGNDRRFDRGPRRDAAGGGGRRDRDDAPRGRDPRDRRGGREGRDRLGFGGPPPHRESRPPAPPPEESEYEEVTADLAVAILDTAAKLTAIVGAAGLPESLAERREAVLETFEAVYHAVLETVSGGGEES